jgi:hypothetical protein
LWIESHLVPVSINWLCGDKKFFLIFIFSALGLRKWQKLPDRMMLWGLVRAKNAVSATFSGFVGWEDRVYSYW